MPTLPRSRAGIRSHPGRGRADPPQLCRLFRGVLLGRGPVGNLTAHPAIGPWADSGDGRAIVECRGQGAGLLPQTGLSRRRGRRAVSSHVGWGPGGVPREDGGPRLPCSRLSTEAGEAPSPAVPWGGLGLTGVRPLPRHTVPARCAAAGTSAGRRCGTWQGSRTRCRGSGRAGPAHDLPVTARREDQRSPSAPPTLSHLALSALLCPPASVSRPSAEAASATRAPSPGRSPV